MLKELVGHRQENATKASKSEGALSVQVTGKDGSRFGGKRESVGLSSVLVEGLQELGRVQALSLRTKDGQTNDDDKKVGRGGEIFKESGIASVCTGNCCN